MAVPDAGLELKPEVEERLASSSKLPHKSLISAADMRKQLGLRDEDAISLLFHPDAFASVPLNDADRIVACKRNKGRT